MDKLIAVAPDGRRVQVMQGDVEEYRALGYQFDGDGPASKPAPAPKVKRQPHNPKNIVDLP